jgi:hypothetical protein
MENSASPSCSSRAVTRQVTRGRGVFRQFLSPSARSHSRVATSTPTLNQAAMAPVEAEVPLATNRAVASRSSPACVGTRQGSLEDLRLSVRDAKSGICTGVISGRDDRTLIRRCVRVRSIANRQSCRPGTYSTPANLNDFLAANRDEGKCGTPGTSLAVDRAPTAKTACLCEPEKQIANRGKCRCVSSRHLPFWLRSQ